MNMIVVFVVLLAVDAALGRCDQQSGCNDCVNHQQDCFWCPSSGKCDKDGNLCSNEKARQCPSPTPPPPTPPPPTPAPCGPPVTSCGTSSGCFFATTRANCGTATTTNACEDGTCRNCRYDYGQWSACSASCGAGTQTRTATLVPKIGQGSSCGTAQTTQSCTGTMCPVDCMPSVWSGWSQCSQTCGVGFSKKVRARTPGPPAVYGGRSCDPLTETMLCDVPECETPMPTPVFIFSDPPTPKPTPSTTRASTAPIETQATSSDNQAFTSDGASTVTASATTTQPAPTPRPNEVYFDFSQEFKTATLSGGVTTKALHANLTLAALGSGTVAVELTAGSTGVGVRDQGASTPAGEIASPNMLEFSFDVPHLIIELALSNFGAGESGVLICLEPRASRARSESVTVDLTMSKQNVAGETMRGYKRFRVVPAAGSSFGVESMNVALVDSAPWVPPAADAQSSALAGGLSPWQLYALIGGGACCCIIIAIVVIVIVVRKTNDDDDDNDNEALRAVQRARAATELQSESVDTRALAQSLIGDTSDSVPGYTSGGGGVGISQYQARPASQTYATANFGETGFQPSHYQSSPVAQSTTVIYSKAPDNDNGIALTRSLSQQNNVANVDYVMPQEPL